MNFQTIAESEVHPGRRLLVGHNGDGYIQLEADTEPIAVSKSDFLRLRTMRHYRSVTSEIYADPLAVLGEQEHAAF